MFLKKIIQCSINVIKDYALNCTLTGVKYIADENYHYIERIFWLICVSLSTFGSFYLIQDYRIAFERNAISLVVENISPKHSTQFPSIGVCELGSTHKSYPALDDFVEKLGPTNDDINKYDIIDFLLRTTFPNLYSFDSFNPYCSPYIDCKDCLKCPKDKYEEIAEKIRTNCYNLFDRCSWMGQSFNCCNFFLPFKTTVGNCFLLNSIQITERNSKNWLNMNVDWSRPRGELEIILNEGVSVYILNENDIPNILLSPFQFLAKHEGHDESISLAVQDTLNDPDVKQISIPRRKCIFPDEKQKQSSFKFYSYSACVTDCIKDAQLKMCNCTHFNMIQKGDNRTPVCDYNGFLCIDRNELIFPSTKILQPWYSEGFKCNCLPSCNAQQVEIVGRYLKFIAKSTKRNLKIKLQRLPSQIYRRFAVRPNFDYVVMVGGILSLFMGASLLSGVELLYFLTVRFLTNFFRL